MISAILIYGQRGEILASRIYRDGLRRAVTEAFRVQVISNAEISSPILTMGSTSFLHIKHNELFIVAVTRHDVNAVAVFEMLYKVVDIVKQQLGSLDESTCHCYVSQVYEILDEIVDYGFLQNTETGFLRLHGTAADNSHSIGVSNGGAGENAGMVSSLKRSLTVKPASHASRNASIKEFPTPWRRGDIKYRRNEVYLDVVEKISTVFEPSGEPLSASVDGFLKVNSQLSGMPRCQVNLSQFEIMENSQLHSCVDRAEFQASGKIQFIPPDGEFELLRYRVTRGIKVPFSLQNYEHNGEFLVHLRSNIDSKKYLADVVVLVPLASNSTSNSQRFKANTGKAKFSPENSAIQWKISRLSGQNETVLRISGDEPLTGHGPIQIKFSVSMYASSSLKVDSLQVVEESKYSALKWVRYLTESGSCEARTA